MSVDLTLAALADPTRRTICQRLAQGRATAGQLAELFPISRPATSQHLRVLVRSGVIRLAGESRQSPYQLQPEPLLLLEDWVSRLVRAWQHAPLILDDDRPPSPRRQRS